MVADGGPDFRQMASYGEAEIHVETRICGEVRVLNLSHQALAPRLQMTVRSQNSSTGPDSRDRTQRSRCFAPEVSVMKATDSRESDYTSVFGWPDLRGTSVRRVA